MGKFEELYESVMIDLNEKIKGFTTSKETLDYLKKHENELGTKLYFKMLDKTPPLDFDAEDVVRHFKNDNKMLEELFAADARDGDGQGNFNLPLLKKVGITKIPKGVRDVVIHRAYHFSPTKNEFDDITKAKVWNQFTDDELATFFAIYEPSVKKVFSSIPISLFKTLPKTINTLIQTAVKDNKEDIEYILNKLSTNGVLTKQIILKVAEALKYGNGEGYGSLRSVVGDDKQLIKDIRKILPHF